MRLEFNLVFFEIDSDELCIGLFGFELTVEPGENAVGLCLSGNNLEPVGFSLGIPFANNPPRPRGDGATLLPLEGLAVPLEPELVLFGLESVKETED